MIAVVVGIAVAIVLFFQLFKADAAVRALHALVADADLASYR